ncbi:MAG: ABC transporter ATP-binding protein, partial [Sulfolobus sp.]|nr:ABC transporter ATP-binding protein [Sulfolobus sp.]
MLIKGLRVKLGERIILNDITIKFGSGINLILGPNGSGKTTLLRTIIGMIKPYLGEVKTDKEISYSPAEFYSPQLKVRDVLLAGRKKGDYDKFVKALNAYKLLDRDFSTLSSGEKRLILVMKALAEGDLVIMDEPLSNLDVANKRKIIEIILAMKGEKQFLITSH